MPTATSENKMRGNVPWLSGADRGCVSVYSLKKEDEMTDLKSIFSLKDEHFINIISY